MALTGDRSMIRAGTGVLIAVLMAACSDSSVSPDAPPIAGPSTALGRWTPGPDDTCTKEIHEGHATRGPDGKIYPTWHPPTDPATGCTFGHEHGRDPRGSAIFAATGPIPFGYANEQLDIWDPALRRHEDHVGHKIEWENDFQLRFDGVAGQLFEVRCDFLTKLHQGSHSKDAFTNNLHELVYHIRCDDGTDMSLTLMAAIGTAGEFVATCDHERHVSVGPPSPAGSPDGGGKRVLPDRDCVEQHMLVPIGERSNLGSALRESWQLSQSIRTAENRTVAHINPYYNVILPSRFHDPAIEGGVGRPIDICYETLPDGRRTDTDACDDSTLEGTLVVPFDDPRSAFDGVNRSVDVNSNRITNADGPSTWYTDPFGKNGRREPFPGSIAQFIASIDNDRAVNPGGPAFGRNRQYGGTGVHAPN